MKSPITSTARASPCFSAGASNAPSSRAGVSERRLRFTTGAWNSCSACQPRSNIRWPRSGMRTFSALTGEVKANSDAITARNAKPRRQAFQADASVGHRRIIAAKPLPVRTARPPYRPAASCADRYSSPIALPAPQTGQHFLARVAVLGQAGARLVGHDGSARSRADAAVDLAVIIAMRGQPLLQFLALLERQLDEGPIPVPHQAAITGNLVGEETDGQRIFVGVGVALDDIEVLEHQESRAGTS